MASPENPKAKTDIPAAEAGKEKKEGQNVSPWKAEEMVLPKDLTKTDAVNAAIAKQAEFAKYATKVFDRFQKGIDADRAEHGKDSRWRAYHDLCVQHILDYGRRTAGGKNPTDLEGLQGVINNVVSLEKFLGQYEKERPNLTVAKLPPSNKDIIEKNDELSMAESFRWREESGEIFRRYEQIRDSMPEDMKKNDPTCNAFRDKADEYFKIYTEYTQPSVKDESVARLTLWELQKLINAYEPKIKALVEKNDAPKLNLTGLYNFTKDTIGSNIFSRTKTSKTREADVLQTLLDNAGKQEFGKLTQEQLEAVLFVKAHLRDIGGNRLPSEDGTYFNRSDIPAITARLRDEMMYQRPRELYQEILQEKGSELDETDKKGLRLMLDHYNGIEYGNLNALTPELRSKMLATPQEHIKFENDMRRLYAAPGQIAEGEAKIAKGRGIVRKLTFRRGISEFENVPGRFFRNFIAGKLREGAGKLAAGKQEYFLGLQGKLKFDTSKSALPGNVQAGIAGKMNKQMDDGKMLPAGEVDTGERPNVSVELMKTLTEKLAVIDSIGKKDLALKVWKPSGLKVDMVSRNGVSLPALDFVLGTQNSVDPVYGSPQGLNFEVSELTQKDLDFIKSLEDEGKTPQDVVKASE